MKSKTGKGTGAIFGKKGCGKTHTVRTKLIPSLKAEGRDYRVIDLIKEYAYYKEENVIEVDFRSENLKDDLKNVISDLHKDTFIFIDCANLLAYQDFVEGRFAGTKKSDMNWVMDLLEGRDCCLIFERVKLIYDNGIEGRFTDYLLFEPCVDIRFSEKLKNQFGDMVSTAPNYTSKN